MVATRTKPKSTATAAGEAKRPVANGGAKAAGKTKKAAAPKKKASKTTKVAKRSTSKPKVAKRTKKSTTEEDNVDYDVEEVRGVKVEGKVTSYFIKWSGYSEADNSWEPSSNVDCENLVKKFLEKALTNVKDDEASEDDAA